MEDQLRSNPAKSYNSDIFLALQPFKARNLANFSADEVQALLAKPISPKFITGNRFAELIESEEMGSFVDYLQSEAGSPRNAYLYAALLNAFKLKSETAFSKASEAKVVANWNALMIQPTLELVTSSLPGLRYNQDVIDSSLTMERKRRDMNIWMLERLVFCGEAKRLPQDFALAVAELSSKTTGVPRIYGKLRYILCMAIAGPTGQFFRLDLTSFETEAVSKKLNFENDKVEIIITFWNILRWMKSIVSYLPSIKLTPTITRSPYTSVQDTEITMQKSHVDKVFVIPDKYQQQVYDVYRLLSTNNIRNAANYKLFHDGVPVDLNSPPREKNVSILLEVRPKGKVKIPQTSDELKAAIVCVLEFLVDFHSHHYVHRDLRWPNIIRTKAEKYIVIDYELASIEDQEVFWSGQPAFFTPDVRKKRRGYRAYDDIYQVGVIIGRALLLRDPDLWTYEGAKVWDDFAAYLLDIDQQLTAANALSRLQNMFNTPTP